jgi:hypothetical protein
LIDQKITCDGCKEEIELYSPSPTYSYVSCVPVEYRHGNFIHAVYITPEPVQQYCNKCWIKMKKAIQLPKEVGVTEFVDVKLQDTTVTVWGNESKSL